MVTSVGERVTIVFPTYNRWEDTYKTLVALKEMGFFNLPILIYDDCSTMEMPAKISQEFPNVTIIRGTENVRQAVGRNILIENATTDYVLHLDDDSFPIEGRLSEAVAFADEHADLLSLSFPVTETGRGCRVEHSLHNQPYPVQTFEGCASLIRCDAFRSVGGYSSWIGRAFEESELTYRAYIKGYKTIHFPQFRICHRVSEASRDTNAILFFSFRNSVLLYYSLAPILILPLLVARVSINALMTSLKRRTFTPVQAMFATIPTIIRSKIPRSPMKLSEFIYLKSLPLD
jgi:GT2 family glycosyltransferase